MEENYTVFLEGREAGKAQLQQQGLYMKCCCHCLCPDSRVYRLAALWPGGWVSIGIPVPEGEGLALTKKIPARHLQKEGLEFRLFPSDTDVDALLRQEKARREEEARKEEARREEARKEEAARRETEARIAREAAVKKETPAPPEEEMPEKDPDPAQREDAATRERLVPISPEEPFEELTELEKAKLTVVDGQVFAAVPEDS